MTSCGTEILGKKLARELPEESIPNKATETNTIVAMTGRLTKSVAIFIIEVWLFVHNFGACHTVHGGQRHVVRRESLLLADFRLCVRDFSRHQL